MAAGLGSTVIDTITGFSGIVTARVEYLNGDTPRVLVESHERFEGKPLVEWFEVSRLNEKET